MPDTLILRRRRIAPGTEGGAIAPASRRRRAFGTTGRGRARSGTLRVPGLTCHPVRILFSPKGMS